MNRVAIAIALGLMVACGNPASATPKPETSFEYAWSRSAEMIVYGTVASVETIDDPSMRGPYVDVILRLDGVQRGDPEAGTVKVRIEDGISNYLWQEATLDVGDHGLWFLHRVRRPAGQAPVANLIRYMSSLEIADDPAFVETLMHHVIQDTMEQSIRADALTLLETGSEKGDQTVILELGYSESGTLENVEFLQRSGNKLFDDHVFESVVYLHRSLTFPPAIETTRVEITREKFLGNN